MAESQPNYMVLIGDRNFFCLLLSLDVGIWS